MIESGTSSPTFGNVPLMYWPLDDSHRHITSYPDTAWSWKYLGLNPGMQCPPYEIRYLDDCPSYWRDESIPYEQDRAQADPGDMGRVNCYAGHEGTDIWGELGDPVYAVADGDIIAFNKNGNNSTITITHRRYVDGVTYTWKARYVHLKGTFPKTSGHVDEGKIIGYVGGKQHLHYEVEALDGGIFDDKGCVGTCIINPFGHPAGNDDVLTNLWIGNTYPCIQGFVSTQHVPFCDVPTQHSFYKEIWFLNALNFVKGYSDGLFHPERSITREQAALILWRWLEKYVTNSYFSSLPSFCPNPSYPDLRQYCLEDNLDVVRAAEFLLYRGVARGCSDGYFHPERNITRGEAVTMIINALKQRRPNQDILTDPDFTSNLKVGMFEDTHHNIHHNNITHARWIGLVHGYSNNTFLPDHPITRGEFAKIMARAIYYAENPDINYLPHDLSEKLDYKLLHIQMQFRGWESQITKDFSFVQSTSNPSSLYCFPAAAGVSIAGLSVSKADTPVCYWSDDEEFRIIQDVPPDYWARADIEALYNAGISVGCNANGTKFCPLDNTTREQMAIFLLRAMYHYETCRQGACEPGTNYTPPSPGPDVFVDVSSNPASPYYTEHAAWINELYRRGIAHGAPDCRPPGDDRLYYCPDYPVTRAQIPFFLLRTREGQDYVENLPDALGIFEDAPHNDPKAAAFEDLYWQGITRGSPDCPGDSLRYCPGDTVDRGHAAAFLVRTFVNLPIPTDRMGDFCFSTSSGYDIPRVGPGYILENVADEDIVCYHKEVNQFKMHFNGSVHGIDHIDIDALTIPKDGEIWFSTRNTKTIPGVGDVKDEDVVRYENGSFSLEIDGSDYTGLGSEDIDALHRYSSSQVYFSTTGNANYQFKAQDEDIVRLNPDNGNIGKFFDGSNIGLSGEDIDSVSVVSNDPSKSIIYITLSTSFCLEAKDGSQLCGDDGDIIVFQGKTGSSTSGIFEAALCFDASEHPGLKHEDVTAIDVSHELDCTPPLPLPDSPGDGPMPWPDDGLQVTPLNLHFNATEGDDESQHADIIISEVGGSVINWTINEDIEWLRLNQTSGTTPAIVPVQIDPNGLFAGTYTGTLTIDASGALNSPQTVHVTLDVAVGYGTVPIILTAESGYNNVQLSWNPTNDPYVTAYRVSRAISNTLPLAPIVTLSDTLYFDEDPNLAPDTHYCYQVEARRSNGEVSATSNRACAPIKQLELWAQAGTAAPGETATVLVGVRNAQGLRIASSDIWLDFDANVLEHIGIASTPLTADYSWEAGLTMGDSDLMRLRIAALATPPPALYNDGALFELTFQVLGSDSYTTPLDLREFIEGVGGSTIYSADDLYNSISLVLEDDVFRVKGNRAYMRGDLNGNGVVEAIDAYIVQQSANGEINLTPQQKKAGDVNADGEVNAEDVTMILYRASHGEWPPLPEQELTHRRLPSLPTIVRLDDVSGLPGEKVEATLHITDAFQVSGGTFAIAYAPELVASIEDVEATGIADQLDLEFYDDGAGLLHLSIAGDVPISGTGEIATLSLRLTDGAQTGDSAPIQFTEIKLNDVHGRDLANSVIQQPVQWHNALVEIIDVPTLQLNPTDLKFKSPKGESYPENRAFVISNPGTGVLHWTANETTDWLNLSQHSGTAPSIVQVSVNTNELPLGVYQGVITVTSPNNQDILNKLYVTLEITPRRVYLPLVAKTMP